MTQYINQKFKKSDNQGIKNACKNKKNMTMKICLDSKHKV